MPFLPEQTQHPGGKAVEKHSLKGADPLSAPSWNSATPLLARLCQRPGCPSSPAPSMPPTGWQSRIPVFLPFSSLRLPSAFQPQDLCACRAICLCAGPTLTDGCSGGFSPGVVSTQVQPSMRHPGAPLSLADRYGGPSSICGCLSLLWGLVHVCSRPSDCKDHRDGLRVSEVTATFQCGAQLAEVGSSGQDPRGFRCLLQSLPPLVTQETYTTSERPTCSVLVWTSSGHLLVGLCAP